MILREHELTAWGGRIGREIGLPVFIGLSGPLGAGKSVLARAVARGAGVSARLPSPTFGLLFRYPAREGVEVVHADLYRLHDPEEIWELGWEELGAGREIALVEWPHRAGAYLPGGSAGRSGSQRPVRHRPSAPSRSRGAGRHRPFRIAQVRP